MVVLLLAQIMGEALQGKEGFGLLGWFFFNVVLLTRIAAVSG